ncbi:MAG: hypothetical protein WC989_06350 [Micavibrio sp.]
MSNAFHTYNHRARRLVWDRLKTLHAEHPPSVGLAGRLEAHFSQKETVMDAPALYACLCLLPAQNALQALKKFYLSMGYTCPESARHIFMQAVNDAAPVLSGGMDLYAAGLIATPFGHKLIRKGLEKNGDFDQMRRKVAPPLEPLVAQALGYALQRRNPYGLPLGYQSLLYITAQLLPDGPGKNFAFNKLSLQTHAKRYGMQLTNAGNFITLCAPDLGIDLAAQNVALRYGSPGADTGPSFLYGRAPARRMPYGAALPGSFPAEAGGDDIFPSGRQLMARLKNLVAEGIATRNDARLYQWYRSGNGYERTANDVARHFQIEPARAEHIIESFNRIFLQAAGRLHESSAEPLSNVYSFSLHGNRHKPRAIRP